MIQRQGAKGPNTYRRQAAAAEIAAFNGRPAAQLGSAPNSIAVPVDTVHWIASNEEADLAAYPGCIHGFVSCDLDTARDSRPRRRMLIRSRIAARP